MLNGTLAGHSSGVVPQDQFHAISSLMTPGLLITCTCIYANRSFPDTNTKMGNLRTCTTKLPLYSPIIILALCSKEYSSQAEVSLPGSQLPMPPITLKLSPTTLKLPHLLWCIMIVNIWTTSEDSRYNAIKVFITQQLLLTLNRPIYKCAILLLLMLVFPLGCYWTGKSPTSACTGVTTPTSTQPPTVIPLTATPPTTTTTPTKTDQYVHRFAEKGVRIQ